MHGNSSEESRPHGAAVLVVLVSMATILAGCFDSESTTTTTTTTTMTTTTETNTTTTTATTVTTTTTTTTVWTYACESNYKLSNVAKLSQKGMCVDDTTLLHCPDKITGIWPNTAVDRVTSYRLFKAWDPNWGGDAVRWNSWGNLKHWLEVNNAKVFMGTSVTCDKAADDQSWAWTRELMRYIGGERVLAVAIGNEMDIFFRNAPPECNNELWNGRYWQVLQDRVADMDRDGLRHAKVTIVWSTGVGSNWPWQEDGNAKVNSLVTQASGKWGERWIWVFNVYAVWDVSVYPHNVQDCAPITHAAVSLDYLRGVLKDLRDRVTATTGSSTSTMWVGENGWSSPISVGHPVFPFCPMYGSVETLREAYENFMKWDLSLPDGRAGVERAFYFTMRDALNLYASEHFGLIARCEDSQCRIQQGSEQGNTEEQVKLIV